jgi:glycosyltransferase involved in cell wall biosynthesis
LGDVELARPSEEQVCPRGPARTCGGIVLPDLTIVIPSYRAERWVARAIRSALDEGAPAHNLVVIEDGVFDDTAAVVRGFEGVRLVSLERNLGAPHARNLGLSLATTGQVMFLDVDDYVENGLLRGLADALDREDADLALGPWRYDGDGSERRVLRTPVELDNGERIFRWKVSREFFPPCCVAWRTESLRAIGAWDENLRKDQDGELVIRALTRGLRVAVSKVGNGVYWQHRSPHRVHHAHSTHVMHAAEVTYRQIRDWVDACAPPARERYRMELGRYCCKTAWVAYSRGDDAAGAQWSGRARNLGFSNRGYNASSALLASLFGMRMSSRIKTRGMSLYHRLAHR